MKRIEFSIWVRDDEDIASNYEVYKQSVPQDYLSKVNPCCLQKVIAAINGLALPDNLEELE